MNSPSFAQELKYWRKVQLLSQAELATRAGYSVSTIRKLESSVLRPSLQIAHRLADTLQLQVEERARFLELSQTLPSRTEGRSVSATREFNEHRQELNGNLLPHYPTALIGRELDIQAGIQALLSTNVRLVTITGPGGVGKTRLSIALAEAVQLSFPDGIVFVSLAELREPALLASTILQAIRIPLSSSQNHVSQLLAYFKDKALLLILDNFEHLVGAASLVRELIESSPS